MVEFISMVALWCGQPNTGAISVAAQLEQINSCRKRMIACGVEMKAFKVVKDGASVMACAEAELK